MFNPEINLYFTQVCVNTIWLCSRYRTSQFPNKLQHIITGVQQQDKKKEETKLRALQTSCRKEKRKSPNQCDYKNEESLELCRYQPKSG